MLRVDSRGDSGQASTRAGVSRSDGRLAVDHHRGRHPPDRGRIDLAALAHNAALIAGLTGTAVCAVVKADAYGHGAPAVARSLEAAGAVAGFAVSLVEEGVQLRDAGVRGPVLVMGPAQVGGGAEMVGAR
ncbi:MAG: alanine racemase [Tessaracoccus sp.]|uniref:alanine racemase n=1 Tax=Tessaracoccus sp. TaxID=1971211 RepID=UPI001EB66B02|nr:alanine racemase [Tessaracoccus sp.]MBK7823535.1 alanine racemase [Tessaracoccus sp.]